MAAAAPDRLSDLPDDLLIHILSFAPSREAASTTALSRRWRLPLWLDTGVVNFDQRSYDTTTTAVPLWRRVREDALRTINLYHSSGRDPRKLTLILRHDIDTTEGSFQEDDHNDEDATDDSDSRGAKAAERLSAVEEHRVEWLDCASPVLCRYTFSPGSVPFAALRVLEFTGYVLLPYSGARRPLMFPRLEAMRIRRCCTDIATLQGMIYAAPKLADICLEAVCFSDDQHEYKLHCPTATAIAIADLHVFRHQVDLRGCHAKLVAPCVRRLDYTNVRTYDETYFSLEQHPDLEQVHLAVHSNSTQAMLMRGCFLTTVHHIRILKLTAYSIAELVGAMKHRFSNLERLEIEELCGWCVPNHVAAASAFVNLLRQCPRMRELRVKFSWRKYLEETTNPSVLNAAMSDFSPCRSICLSGGDKGVVTCCDGLDLDELCCGCNLDCLQSSLKRVVVEFDAEELTCFQVRLIKFLAKNAVALKEFVVDGGKAYDSSNINRDILRWKKKKRLEAASQQAVTVENPCPQWPPSLSEFPSLRCALASDPNPATPCYETPAP